MPVRSDAHDWLRGTATCFWAGSDGTASTNTVSLPQHCDAIVYIERTTPIENLR